MHTLPSYSAYIHTTHLEYKVFQFFFYIIVIISTIMTEKKCLACLTVHVSFKFDFSSLYPSSSISIHVYACYLMRILMLNGFENKINDRNLQISHKIYFFKFQPSTSHMDGDRLVKVHTFNSR